ncbi:hypothetical protein L873DRAFT_1809866 [Choiromyces venosus 120613-1]|uniref:Uncharacterized protein n=1 Tax=Choiromyces venosus 120613-1 TaxID=1336337 RepID=A0A3N4JUF5_9PEZI|nr:hypothetical protein L873DRAFT_1809866 [Choiromyces venosus 120613-1]
MMTMIHYLRYSNLNQSINHSLTHSLSPHHITSLYSHSHPAGACPALTAHAQSKSITSDYHINKSRTRPSVQQSLLLTHSLT